MTSMKTIILGILLAPITLHAAGPGKAAIASAHYLATEAGHEVLAKGGNAFDAAIAVSATLAVVEPTSSGLGGGALWLLHRASDGFEVMIDGREKAPAAATPDMFLDAHGDVDRDRAFNGPLAAGIPGEPAGLVYLAEHYGRLPLSESLAPAIRAAEQGFEIGDSLARRLQRRAKVMHRYSAAAAIFLPGGKAPASGSRLLQKDLGLVLRQLAAHGSDGFYRGEVAARLVRGVEQAGGIWTSDDLKAYRVVERKPIRFSYRGATVVSAPPPSAGGIVLAEMLHIIEGYDVQNWPRMRVTTLSSRPCAAPTGIATSTSVTPTLCKFRWSGWFQRTMRPGCARPYAWIGRPRAPPCRVLPSTNPVRIRRISPLSTPTATWWRPR